LKSKSDGIEQPWKRFFFSWDTVPGGIVLTILSACCFGLLPLFAKTAYAGGFNPYAFSLFRVVFTAMILFVILKGKKKSLAIEKQQAITLFKASFFGYYLMMITICVSYTLMDTGIATVLHFIYPMATMAGALMIYKEKINAVQIGAMAVSLLGIYFLVGLERHGAVNFAEFALALSSGFFYAYYILTVSHGTIKTMDSFVVIFYITLFNSVTLFVTCLITGNFPREITPMGFMGTVMVALVSSVIGMVAFQAGLKKISATSATILSTFEVVTSLIVGISLLGESFSVFQMGGSVLIMASVVTVSFAE
jgi:drug/metabolite transporter (DMT)-like permease